jgi:hypothetical protein
MSAKKKPTPKPPRTPRVRTKPTPPPELVAAPVPPRAFLDEPVCFTETVEATSVRLVECDEKHSGLVDFTAFHGQGEKVLRARVPRAEAERIATRARAPIFAHGEGPKGRGPFLFGLRFLERVRHAIEAGAPLPWPDGAPTIDDIGRLSLSDLYRLSLSFEALPGTRWYTDEHRRYCEEIDALRSLRLGRLRKTIHRHLWDALEGSPEDLGVLRGVAATLQVEDREEVLAPLRTLAQTDWEERFGSCSAPDDEQGGK